MKGVVGAFANDPRILAWDVWNEPDNGDGIPTRKSEPKNKNEIILGLLPQVFAWARTAHPTQPLTSGSVAWGLEFAGHHAADGAHSD